MQVEVTAAINLIAASLYHKLPRRRVDAFAEEIEKGITAKFQGHWYPENPSKGAAYRCINVSGEKVDPVIIYAVINSGLDIEEVNNYLPKDLTIWIDPGEVSFSIGEKGQVRLLYSERRPTSGASSNNSEDSGCNTTMQQPIPFTSNGNASTGSSVMSTPLGSPDELTSNLSSSFGSLSLSSGGSNNCQQTNSWGAAPSPIPWSNATTSCNNNPWSPLSTQKPASSFPAWSNGGSNFPNTINNTQSSFLIGANPAPAPAPVPTPTPVARPTNVSNNKTMTAAMFAQTKFGSTKLKTHGKRSNRLSPTENFTRALNGANTYGQMRHNPTMNPAFIDRMHSHMHPMQHNNNNDFPIDFFKISAGNSNNAPRSSERFNMPTNSNYGNFNGSINGHIGRNSPCTIGTLGGMLGVDQDWLDLTDISTPTQQSGNQLLAA